MYAREKDKNIPFITDGLGKVVYCVASLMSLHSIIERRCHGNGLLNGIVDSATEHMWEVVGK